MYEIQGGEGIPPYPPPAMQVLIGASGGARRGSNKNSENFQQMGKSQIIKNYKNLYFLRVIKV